MYASNLWALNVLRQADRVIQLHYAWSDSEDSRRCDSQKTCVGGLRLKWRRQSDQVVPRTHGHCCLQRCSKGVWLYIPLQRTSVNIQDLLTSCSIAVVLRHDVEEVLDSF